jgi:hypothetical protein
MRAPAGEGASWENDRVAALRHQLSKLIAEISHDPVPIAAWLFPGPCCLLPHPS